MKIRNCFVTNSSSSSFIISVHGSKAEPLVRLFKYMCDKDNYGLPQVIDGFEHLGTVMDIQKKIKEDEFWGHEELRQRIEDKDTTLLDKDFYDMTFERGLWELHDILMDLIDATDGIKIESTESY